MEVVTPVDILFNLSAFEALGGLAFATLSFHIVPAAAALVLMGGGIFGG